MGKTEWDGGPIEYHDVMIALSEARAARWMFNALDAGNLGLEPESATRGWLRNWADEALGRALDQAEIAFREHTASGPALRLMEPLGREPDEENT
jgi:hypothetical protein